MEASLPLRFSSVSPNGKDLFFKKTCFCLLLVRSFPASDRQSGSFFVVTLSGTVHPPGSCAVFVLTEMMGGNAGGSSPPPPHGGGRVTAIGTTTALFLLLQLATPANGRD